MDLQIVAHSSNGFLFIAKMSYTVFILLPQGDKLGDLCSSSDSWMNVQSLIFSKHNNLKC